MSKYTPWFSHKVKPVRVGAYEVRDADKAAFDHGKFAYWNGAAWSWACLKPYHAANYPNCYGAEQAKQWRGLTKPAKA